MIQTVYGLPAKFVGYMGLPWAERRNNTHSLPITRQLWVVFRIVLRVFVFRVLLFGFQTNLNKPLRVAFQHFGI